MYEEPSSSSSGYSTPIEKPQNSRTALMSQSRQSSDRDDPSQPGWTWSSVPSSQSWQHLRSYRKSSRLARLPVLCAVVLIINAAYLFSTHSFSGSTIGDTDHDNAFPPPKQTYLSDVELWKKASAHNALQLQRLAECLETSSCRPRQNEIIIFHGQYVMRTLSMVGVHGGEFTWAASIYRAAQLAGYTCLYEAKLDPLAALYMSHAEAVRAIIMDPPQIARCIRTGVCGLTGEGYEEPSIPITKTLSMHFWAEPAHALGGRFTINPEDYNEYGRGSANAYLGYSVEAHCQKAPFIPHARRKTVAPPAVDSENSSILPSWVVDLLRAVGVVPKPTIPVGRGKSLFIMGKKWSYFAAKLSSWPLDFFHEVHNTTEVTFELGTKKDFVSDNDDEFFPKLDPPTFLNHGFMAQEVFLDAISRSWAMVGLRLPYISPSPYEALCVGVPFINPVYVVDQRDPLNRKRWESQHDGLKFLDPPYVYNVRAKDREGFMNAIEQALANPIDRYILPRMTNQAVADRLMAILDRDVETLASEYIQRKIQTTGTPFNLSAWSP